MNSTPEAPGGSGRPADLCGERVRPVVPNTVLTSLDDSRSSHDVSYRIEPDYRLTGRVLVYASVATAYKAGIFHWLATSGLKLRVAATYLNARRAQMLTNDNGLVLYAPGSVGQMLPDPPSVSGGWILSHARPVSATWRAHSRATDHHADSEHPCLADRTTFGRSHLLGARLGIRAPSQHWDASVEVTTSDRNASADARVRRQRRPAGVGRRETPCVRGRPEPHLLSRVSHCREVIPATDRRSGMRTVSV